MVDLTQSTSIACQNEPRTTPVRRSSASYRAKSDTSGTAPRAAALQSIPCGRRNEFWVNFVGTIDSALRFYYNIIEFSDDPGCVLRVGLAEAERSVSLSGGIEIVSGEKIGAIHFWNERLPAFSASGGPDLRWAVDMRRRVVRSLALLARFVECDDDWRDLRALRGEAAFSSRIGDKQLQRVADHYGFECIVPPFSVRRRLHDFGACFNAWGLARAYNPAALARQRLFRRYQELWLSRATLLDRYGTKTPRPDERAQRHVGETVQWPFS